MILSLGLNGRKCSLFLWTNIHGKSGAAEAAENFNKFQNLVKYTSKMGKIATVIVGKTDFNTQKPVLEKNTIKTPKKIYPRSQ